MTEFDKLKMHSEFICTLTTYMIPVSDYYFTFLSVDHCTLGTIDIAHIQTFIMCTHLTSLRQSLFKNKNVKNNVPSYCTQNLPNNCLYDHCSLNLLSELSGHVLLRGSGVL